MAILANSQTTNTASVAGGGTIKHGKFCFNATDTTAELATGLTVIRNVQLTPVIPTSVVSTTVLTAVAADRTVSITLPKVRGVISGITVKSSVAVDASDTNYWAVGIENASNSNAVVVNKATAANTSKSTGGSAYVANTAKALTLTSTVADKTVTEGDTLTLTLDATGSATTMPVFTIAITVTGQNAGVPVVDQTAIATQNATFTTMIRCPVSGVITGLKAAVQTSITANDTDYWTVTAVNKGANGGGSAAVLATSDANTTKATGGAGLTNFLDRAFTLTATTADKTVVAGQIIAVTCTKAANGADWILPVFSLEITPSTSGGPGAGEDLFVDEPVDSQGYIYPVSGAITVGRRAGVTTNLPVYYWIEGY